METCEGASHSMGQTSTQELVLAKCLKQSKKFISQSLRLSITEKTSSANIKISGGGGGVMTSTGGGGAAQPLTRMLDLFESGSSASDDEAAAPAPMPL
jgi:hypothetical protein